MCRGSDRERAERLGARLRQGATHATGSDPGADRVAVTLAVDLAEVARMFGLVGTLTAAEGHGDELAGHLLEAARELERVSTCQLYLVSRVPSDPDVVHVVEVWDDEDAHRASLELAPVQRLIGRARPIITAMGDRVELRPVGGKGLAAGL